MVTRSISAFRVPSCKQCCEIRRTASGTPPPNVQQTGSCLQLEASACFLVLATHNKPRGGLSFSCLHLQLVTRSVELSTRLVPPFFALGDCPSKPQPAGLCKSSFHLEAEHLGWRGQRRGRKNAQQPILGDSVGWVRLYVLLGLPQYGIGLGSYRRTVRLRIPAELAWQEP